MADRKPITVEDVHVLPPDPISDGATSAALTRAEIDTQVATARAFPRSIQRFQQSVRDMALLSEEVAESCIYTLPRAGKAISGASVRFAEIVRLAWQNCRIATRIIGEDATCVIVQGAFHDLENNVAVMQEVRRRITKKDGARFDDDMIQTTVQAASGIAARNAVLKGVPESLWRPMYAEAQQVAIGAALTMEKRRARAMEIFAKMGVAEDRVLARMGRGAVRDLTLDDLATLSGLRTALKNGDATPEEVFPTVADTVKAPSAAKPAVTPASVRVGDPAKHRGPEHSPIVSKPGTEEPSSGPTEEEPDLPEMPESEPESEPEPPPDPARTSREDPPETSPFFREDMPEAEEEEEAEPEPAMPIESEMIRALEAEAVAVAKGNLQRCHKEKAPKVTDALGVVDRVLGAETDGRISSWGEISSLDLAARIIELIREATKEGRAL